MFFAFSCEPDGRIIELIRNDLPDDYKPGSIWIDMVHPAAREEAASFLRSVSSGQSAAAELPFGLNGSNLICDLVGIPNGNLCHIAGVCSEHESAQQAHRPLSTSTEPPAVPIYPGEDSDPDYLLLKRILNASPDTVIISDTVTGEVVYQNRSLDFIYQTSSGSDRLTRSLLDASLHPHDRSVVEEHLNAIHTLAVGETREIEFRVSGRNEEWRWYVRRDTVLSAGDDARPQEILSLYQDIHERRLAQQKLYRMSTRDPLTELYNRVYFEQEIERLQDSRQYPISILIADVDGLKAINDSLGHASGDRLIKRAADVLRAAFRNEDVVARIGGDEFGVILANTSADDLPNILQRVDRILHEFNEDLTQIEILLSMGYATAESGDLLDQTLREADLRMYSNKTERKSNGFSTVDSA